MNKMCQSYKQNVVIAPHSYLDRFLIFLDAPKMDEICPFLRTSRMELSNHLERKMDKFWVLLEKSNYRKYIENI